MSELPSVDEPKPLTPTEGQPVLAPTTPGSARPAKVVWVPTKTQMWTSIGIATAALGFAVSAFAMALVAFLAVNGQGLMGHR
ncbi:MAG: hypothetical protein JOY77_09050 [Alphaproteobacteria bacterium]|nr:hypothetical protein [Alphaproteobacteria bacterium]